MTNLEVAIQHVENAIAYGNSGSLEVVMTNLGYLKALLEKPNELNEEYIWDDFK